LLNYVILESVKKLMNCR